MRFFTTCSLVLCSLTSLGAASVASIKPSSTKSASATSTKPSTSTTTASLAGNSAFYLRLKQPPSTTSAKSTPSPDPLNGYWVNAVLYDQPDGSLGQYLAVTKDMPQHSFVLTNGQITLTNGTLDGKPNYFIADGQGSPGGVYQSPWMLHANSKNTAGPENIVFTWNQTQNMLTVSSTTWYYDYFGTCKASGQTTVPSFVYDSSFLPQTPLFVGQATIDHACTLWTIEVVPASSVKAPTGTQTSTTAQTATSLPSTSTKGMAFSQPFYLKLASGSSAGVANYTGSYATFMNYTTATGHKAMYLGIVDKKPTAPMYISSGNIMMQLTHTSFGTPGFVTSRNVGLGEFVYLTNYHLPLPLSPLTFNYDFLTQSMTGVEFLSPLVLLTCTPDGHWNSTILPAPPVIVNSLQGPIGTVPSGCQQWHLAVEYAANACT
ncbi:hypothetical protein K461DRAFT_268276 [Myriangium duriaei CBS 260.36]|uniref:Uncharacterized protein n=1 Tax=Myriangium duriaei CBS 260.36 TaxID=1168546 RepID=A0A9P4J0C7_9PEZI|nr:hypothetical protein K461DRAFT_268276 [Myriangium duriaei CBS 260.36]